MSVSPPETKVGKHTDYRIVSATGVFGGLIPLEGQLIFYTDRLEPKTDNVGNMSIGHVNRELQIEIHMSPTVFKSVAEWMSKHIHEFEKREKQQIGTVKMGQPPDKMYI